MTCIEGSQVNVSTSNGNNEDVESSNASGGSKPMKGTSFVWNYITRVDVNGIRMAKCDFCGKLLNATQGTSSLRKHVLKCRNDHQEATNLTNTSFDQNVGLNLSRNMLKSEIFKLYNMEMDKTLKLLDSIESKIAITIDRKLSAITVDNCSTNDSGIPKEEIYSTIDEKEPLAST
ncbi:hypothetical protein EZV62_003293 [Acer yangbiense]|uniref:BED-type domain-containing protein n=1 Tax=Acer yangbiense TaxID=1000413 RepID=A0A5C7IH11_9ROSI|nr:hypothetical protein EZV62_003293 [Acer yangbiense]